MTTSPNNCENSGLYPGPCQTSWTELFYKIPWKFDSARITLLMNDESSQSSVFNIVYFAKKSSSNFAFNINSFMTEVPIIWKPVH